MGQPQVTHQCFSCKENVCFLLSLCMSLYSRQIFRRFELEQSSLSQCQLPPCSAQMSFFSKVSSRSTTLGPDSRGYFLLVAFQLYFLASKRLSDLCERIRIDERGRRMMWTVFEYILKDERSLFMDRHLDQNLLCIV